VTDNFSVSSTPNFRLLKTCVSSLSDHFLWRKSMPVLSHWIESSPPLVRFVFLLP